MKKKRTYNKAWFDGLTVLNEDIFKEMISPLSQKYREEFFKKLGVLLCDSVDYEVKFSNYTLALIARRIVELFCQEWYNSVPLVFLEGDGKTLVVDWRYPMEKTKTNKQSN